MHEMTASERSLTQSGRGCPTCKGEPVYDCELGTTEYGPLLEPPTNCGHYSYGRCTDTGHCDHKARRNIDNLEALRTWLNNSDEDPIEIINRMVGRQADER